MAGKDRKRPSSYKDSLSLFSTIRSVLLVIGEQIIKSWQTEPPTLDPDRQEVCQQPKLDCDSHPVHHPDARL